MAIQEKTALTFVGVFGALVVVLGGGISCIAAGPIVGGIVALVGLVIGMAGNRNRDLLKCTNCGFKRAF